MDFVKIRESETRDGITIYPEFISGHTKDLMIKGGDFYAFWDDEVGLWNTRKDDVITRIDVMLDKRRDEIFAEAEKSGGLAKKIVVKYMWAYSSGKWREFIKCCKDSVDNYHMLDRKVTFADTNVKQEDYISHKLDYKMSSEIKTPAYDELMSVLYDDEEREKLEWAIGSIISGDSRSIQKFYVLYGPGGTGKSTVLNIIQKIFNGYWNSFVSADLGSANASFALEPFKYNPLIAIEHDGDLSKIETNARLNSLISHETITVNEKKKNLYDMKFDSVLFIGTNTPVRITDQKSGLIRRLIDISPTGKLIAPGRYSDLMDQIDFELGGIAYKCLKVYKERGKHGYDAYRTTKMLDQTNDMYNFMQEMLFYWQDQDSVTLANAWQEYRKWCEDSNAYMMMKRKFKTELKEYFEEFNERQGSAFNVYSGFKLDKFGVVEKKEESGDSECEWLDLKDICDVGESIFDKECCDCYAQYATEDEIPKRAWSSVRTKLKELDTNKLHYVKVPKNHIVIDFDLKDENGQKNYILNRAAASKFPKTYAELSKGGAGIHLHYIYEGDVEKLSRIFDVDIEVKVFTGGSSLRRKLTKCNSEQIATINSGLPLKEVKAMIDSKSVESEKHLRIMVKKCLNKEHHGHTAPEMDFIKKLTDEAYANKGMSYDIRDMRPAIMSFAMSSTNQAQKCFNTAATIHFCSKDLEGSLDIPNYDISPTDEKKLGDWNKSPIVFFDVEVFPNLFIICWKKLGSPKESIVRMINPSPREVEELFKFRLVGFNNRRYDNHIIYAASLGYSNEELFKLSQRIISGSNNSMFGNAYSISYTDIYDYCSNANKMSLKKWEINLGLYHLENQYPWDEPVDEKHWNEIADYCCNDVEATEAVWNVTQPDFRGRQILAELSGLTVNDTSNTHTQQIIFGDDRHPQSKFNIPDLSKEFPGYVFEKGKSTYMGEEVGEGGWVFAKPGMYYDAVCEDVSGMHPASIYAMKLFGEEYTERYYDLVRARTYIKHKQYDKVAKMFDGKLAKYLGSDSEAKELSNALKTPINSVYGLTAASFDNRCRDPRNKDNVVAKRGALFMITLKHKLDDMGVEVIHCKTDSVKIANPTKETLDFVVEFGKQYGYSFEVEDEFERICLVNGSTFIAKDKEGVWEAKAAQFAHPYVFKTLFSGDDIGFADLCETKNVSKGVMYLDFNEGLPEDEHNYKFVGKIGLFTPVVKDGAVLVKSQDQVKYDAVAGTKGYRWVESDTIRDKDNHDSIDMSYFEHLANEAENNIGKYGDFDIFVNADHDMYASYIDSLRDPAFSTYMQSPIEVVKEDEEVPF